MTDSPAPSSSAPAIDATALVERAVHGDRSLAIVMGAILDGADMTGAVPLHVVTRRFIEENSDGRVLVPDEVRSHLAAALLPRLAASGVIEPLASGEADHDPKVRIVPSLWLALDQHRADLARAMRATGEYQVSGATGASPAQVSDASVLSADGLVKVYRGRRVVNDVSVRVAQGEIVGLLGPNGAGKTTTFYMLVGLIAPQSGKINMDGTEITNMPMYERARQGIGYLSQEPSIFRKLTVEQNIQAILETLDLSAAERKERLEMLLDELSIKHLRKSRAFQLSGGERRRLEITRALVTQPKFMMLDEPFAGVDPIAVHDIQQIVAGLRHRGIGVLISDHNVEQTLDIVDRAYIMYDGVVKVSGTVRELVFDDTVAEIYLGPTLSARLRARFAEADEGVRA
jgi:lipopolysaccharide export system ATP-binding protein